MQLWLAQSKTDLPPPSATDWAEFGAVFLVAGVALWVVTAKTRGFERMNAGLPRFFRGPDYDRKRWPYFAAPLLIILVGVLMLTAAVTSR